MAFWLRSEERRVAARGRRVRADLTALGAAKRSLATGLERELRKPKVLLAFFAAGLGYGWLRRAEPPASRSGDEDRSAEQRGRLAKLVAAALAGVRIYAQVRRAAALVEPYAAPQPPRGGNSAAFREEPPEAEQHETYERHERRE